MNRKQRRGQASALRKDVGGAADIEITLTAAAGHREAGRLGEAERLYRRVLDADPHQADALHWLGVIAHMSGRDDRALDLVERAAALRPEDPQCLFHLGEIRRARGLFAAAVECYRLALRFESGMADIHFGLGTALLEMGRAAEAEAALSRAVALSPRDPETHNNLANALMDLDRPDAAQTHYHEAISLCPDSARGHLNLGLALARIGRDREAEASFRNAMAAEPELFEARRQLARLWRRQDRPTEARDLLLQSVRDLPESEAAAYELGKTLQSLERHDQAAKWYRKALALCPKHPRAHNRLGHCLLESERHGEALDHYLQAATLEPSFAEAHFNAGTCLQSLGRFDEAAISHRRALALRPDLAEAHYSLAMIEPGNLGAAEVAGLEALLTRPDLADEARINAGFALARIREDGGDADAAFARYREANDLKSQHMAFDAARHVDYVDRLIATFDQDFFSARRGFGVDIESPIFIVGMPRSGTTLVEQILASHPGVHGAGELDDIRRMVRLLPERLETEAPYPECAAEIAHDMAESLAEAYLGELGERYPEAGRIVDKLTGNYLRLGLIALLLPKATVIHCDRDPLDTCFSCYAQNFAHGLGFSYDLTHLGLVYRQYQRLMKHWRRALPIPIFDLRYEDLVMEPEKISRRMIRFCGLPWDARCLKAHEHSRPVRTASFWQVRQPIYGTSVGRWRPYADHLAPLIAALGRPASGGA